MHYHVFFNDELHSQWKRGQLEELLCVVPNASIIYDPADTSMPWFDVDIKRVEENSISPVVRMLVLLLNL